MLLPDLNVLIYAFDSGAKQHKPCSQWLENALNGDDPECFSWHTIMGMMRIMTTVRMVKNAFTVSKAIDIADDLLSTPVARILVPGDRHMSIFRRLVEETGISGARLSDAHIAALAIEHGATVVSADRDFRAFYGLKLIDPVAG